MTDRVIEKGWGRARRLLSRLSPGLPNALSSAGPPLLFGFRLWASVCLALYVAFSLELDNAFWAGTTAAVVCQPQLGASLRKGWFRMIGNIVAAIAIVALTAGFPQDRIAFLGLLALWCGVCAFVSTLLRNFASYAAALSGYTTAIIASELLGATGGGSPDVFMLAVTRASEVCIGIACAGIVLAGTDLGGARRMLVPLLADLGAEITGRFACMLAQGEPELPDTQRLRRDLARRVIALDPAVDRAIGEASDLRYRSQTLQTAVYSLFAALDGWRAVATHLSRLPGGIARQNAQSILGILPPELRSAPEAVASARWTADPLGLLRVCDGAMRTLLALPASTPSLRLLADQTAKLLAGILHVLEGIALLVDAPDRPLPGRRKFRMTVPDWLPALVNAGRAFVTIGAAALFWIVTAWPSGALSIAFAAIVLLLMSPKGDQAPAAAMQFMVGPTLGMLLAGIAKFAVLPALSTFPSFCIALGIFLIPMGFGVSYSRPPFAAVFTGMPVFFMALLAPENQMNYDTAQYYNSALAVFAGCAAAAFSFRLLPPLSPALRTRRLLVLTLRDLRRLARDPDLRTSDDWEGLLYGRLASLPDEAEPLQRAQLLAALSVGRAIIQLSHIASRLGVTAELDAALAAVAGGNSTTARARLAELDRQLAFHPGTGRGDALTVRARAQLLVISEALAGHIVFFDFGASV